MHELLDLLKGQNAMSLILNRDAKNIMELHNKGEYCMIVDRGN